jgi:hypothetical protein
MESLELPIYIFTFNIEMSQFVFSSLGETKDPIDHSKETRRLA